MRCRAHSLAIAIVGTAAALGAATAAAQPPSAAQSPALAEEPLARKLAQRVTVAWNGQQLDLALGRLTDLMEIPVWLDRRVDPTAPVELAINDSPVREALQSLAADEARDWGWTSLRTVVYVGPRQTARELATLSELARLAIAKAPPDVRRKWQAPSPWSYPRLSEPRLLLAETFAGVGAELGQVDAVPHDLWAARSLPAVAPIDRVVLMLAGFDLTIVASPDGKQLRVAPIARPVQLTREYPSSDSVAAAAAALAEQDESVRVRRQGRRLSVVGRWEDHELLRAVLRGGPANDGPADNGSPPPANVGAQRFTLKIANKPLEPVLTQLAAQLQLTIHWDPAINAATHSPRSALVSCDVREVDLDGLLKAIIAPAGLTFTREGQTVTIRPAN